MKIMFDPFCTPLNFAEKTATFFYSSHLTPLHSHNTLQMIFDLKGTFMFRTEHTNWGNYAGVIIKEDVVHQLNTNNGMQLIIYVDPLSIAAQKLKHKYLTDKDFCDIPIVFTPLEEALIYKNLVTIDKKSIELLMQLIFSRIIDNNSNKLNERITHILRIIKQTPLADLSIQYLAS